ncbi:matrixin family metalloprotease [Terrabacter sp. BE26]|uniref:matrixin family metalloprotease n=1 Tax=Terrabacter sp. BE26 TaxID=2898152 RepID=UPI0035BE5904
MLRLKVAAFAACALAVLGLTQPPMSAREAAPAPIRHDFHDAALGAFTPSTSSTAVAAVTALGSSKDYTLMFPAAFGAPYGRWDPCKPIYWKVNPRWAPKGGVTDLKAAIARVHAATGLTFVYEGTTTLVPGTAAYDEVDTSGQIIIAWAPDGYSTLIPKAPRGSYGPMGVGGGTVYIRSGVDGRQYAVIDSAYVLLSTSFSTLAGGFGLGNRYGWQGTRGMLDMHELGHAIGLQHAQGRSEIMYPYAQRMLANWGAGDLNGLRLLGRAPGCIPELTD